MHAIYAVTLFSLSLLFFSLSRSMFCSMLCSAYDKKNKGEIMHALLSLGPLCFSSYSFFACDCLSLESFSAFSPWVELLLQLPSITACVRGLKAQCVSYSTRIVSLTGLLSLSRPFTHSFIHVGYVSSLTVTPKSESGREWTCMVPLLVQKE